MTILQHTPLIADTPAEILLVLGIFFTLAALILFALALEAGHYRDVTRWLSDLWQRQSRLQRPRRRWMFNAPRRAAPRKPRQARC